MERMIDIDVDIEGPLNKCLFRQPGEDEDHLERHIVIGPKDAPGLVSANIRSGTIYVLIGPTRKDGVCEIHGIKVLQERTRGETELCAETDIDMDKKNDLVLREVGKKVIKTLHCLWAGTRQSKASSK
jgi:hypothetical protein